MDDFNVEIIYGVKFKVSINGAKDEIKAIEKAKHLISENLNIVPISNENIKSEGIYFDHVSSVYTN